MTRWSSSRKSILPSDSEVFKRNGCQEFYKTVVAGASIAVEKSLLHQQSLHSLGAIGDAAIGRTGFRCRQGFAEELPRTSPLKTYFWVRLSYRPSLPDYS